MLIGKHYRRDSYNCAGFVADWYREKLNVEIPVVDEFSLSFVKWMRKHFDEITSPQDNCLVLMTGSDGGYHIGVYYDLGVYHNFKPTVGHGSVCKWQMSAVNAYYAKVSFHKWSQSNTSRAQQESNVS